jgi:NAD(P)-dependent dehydrogenase (short-subunit alcohol dehydrogenase family)
VNDGSIAGGSSTEPVALVTGAARGIGRAIAERLARDGWRLALVDLDEAALAVVEDEIRGTVMRPTPSPRIATYVADVGDEAEVRTLHERVRATFGGLRALVNNAGIGGTGTAIEDVDLATWSEMLRVDLTSVFLMCRAFAPELKTDGAGRVINLGSISAQVGVAGSTAYTAAKGGVVAFSKSLAREWAVHRVTVNVVAPGVVDTEMARRRGLDHQRHAIPWHRIGRPDDVAGAVAYLVSPAAEFMTGQVLHLNGGAAM